MIRTKAFRYYMIAALMLALAALQTTQINNAQTRSRTFPETGKTVSGRFLDYWETHGGLPQQGYPISEAAPERSDIDGKTYTMQYFERAVFEMHPENAPPYDVLLSLLGVFFYQEKYPSGAPGQVASRDNPYLFPQTGKHVGGIFRTYWETHGGLAQQGYPISEEFDEVSATNGRTYHVQYFERAVFEMHPENAPPYNVLLSLLGTFRHQERAIYTPTTTPVVIVDGTTTPAPPTFTPTATATITPGPCNNIPPSQDLEIRPSNCERSGAILSFTGRGFQPGERALMMVTPPNGALYEPIIIDANSDGSVGPISTGTREWELGLYALTIEGELSHHKATGYFKLTP